MRSYVFGGYRSLAWELRRKTLFWGARERALLWGSVAAAMIVGFFSYANASISPVLYYSLLVGFIVLLSYSLTSFMDTLEGKR